MKTDHEKLARKLMRIAQLDMDAVLAYDQAITNLDEGEVEITEALESFQDDHLRHIDDLSAAIRDLGHEVPEFSRDFKGFFIEGMTAVMSKVGTRAALIAMTQNELLTNATYKSALEGSHPSHIKTLLKKNYADEQRHIAFITTALKEKFGLSESNVTRPTFDNLEETLST